MLALCFMLLETYYAQSASILCLSLQTGSITTMQYTSEFASMFTNTVNLDFPIEGDLSN